MTLVLSGMIRLTGLKMTTNPLFGKKAWRDTELERDFQQRVTHIAKLYHWSCYSIVDSRRASLAGYPDLTMWNVQQGRLIFAELKREKGVLSVAQKQVLAELGTLGVEVYVWRPSDFDDIVDLLKGKL